MDKNSNINGSAVPRREFLRGAAMTTIAAAVGMKPLLASAGIKPQRAVAAPIDQSILVFYFDGQNLVPASSLPYGDPTLSAVQLTLQSVNSGNLRALDAVSLVPSTSGVSRVPFQALVTGPNGAPTTRCVMQSDLQQGLQFVAHLAVGAGERTSAFALLPTTGNGNKLRLGTYVVMTLAAMPERLTFDGVKLIQDSGQPFAGQYIVITIANAS